MRRFFFFPLLLLTACVKDKPQPVVNPPVTVAAGKKVYIVNEGNFGSGNSSVSLFDPDGGTVVENYYAAQNGNSPGDVAQSMTGGNGKLYVVVNNSGKIVVCDEALKKTGEIGGLSSPRFMLPVSAAKAYVTDFKAGGIHILNLGTATVTGSIACSGWTERMLTLLGKVYVTNMFSNYVYVVDPANDVIEDSVFVGRGCGSIVSDKNDRLWALASGDAATHSAGRLSCIDPLNKTVLSALEFPAGHSPWNLTINGTKDALFFLDGDIYRMLISQEALPSQAFVAKGARNFYGLGVSPHNNVVYASDALDYTQRSVVYCFDETGKETRSFKAGINAGYFFFE
jgi:YVTN family beta-propeller protein